MPVWLDPARCLAVSIAGRRASFLASGLHWSRCFSFFLGGLCFQAASWINTRGARCQRAAQYGLVMIMAGALILLGSGLFSSLAAHTVALASALRHKVIELSVVQTFLVGWYLRAVLFPALILLLALAEHDLKRATKPFAWLGDISYSSYMLHFSLQLCFVLFLSDSNFHFDFLSVPIFLTFFA